MDVRTNVPLVPLTTFEIGGNAQYFVDVHSEDELCEALAWAAERNLQYHILAGGSNVLIPDEGLSGLVLHITGERALFANSVLEAWAGCSLHTLITLATNEGFGGWERLAGIPGTIGGAVRGNAGAFGSEIKDFVRYVRALNVRTGETREFSNTECEFDYRMSYFKKHPEWIICDVHLSLAPVDSVESSRIRAETIAEREKRHIQNVRAAGSFFMNPVAPQAVVSEFEREKHTVSRGGRVPAGWLIEKVGMKGHRIGDAQSSPQQANYLTNVACATAGQVSDLSAEIRRKVYQEYGIQLTEEAVIM